MLVRQTGFLPFENLLQKPHIDVDVHMAAHTFTIKNVKQNQELDMKIDCAPTDCATFPYDLGSIFIH